MIHFTCTHCQTHLTVSDEKAGNTGKCPKCGHAVQAPSATSALTPHAAPAAAIQRVANDEIPLADEPASRRPEPLRQPFRAPARPAITPPDADEEIDRSEIPLAEEMGEQAKEASHAQEPPPTPGGLIIAPAGDAVVVSFQATKILDALVIETIGQELYALVDKQGCRKVALDFGHVQFLSSQMLGVLISLQKKVAGIKGKLVLCAVQANLQQVFHIAKLERLLPIVADRQTALGVLGLP